MEGDATIAIVAAPLVGVLLLCMPSPGEEDLADTALHHFHGARVAYVGEWGSGMTGTVGLHASLADTRR